MYSFADLDRTLSNQPPRIGVLLQAVNRGQGRQQLFAEQVPRILKQLAETTRIASIQASTAIEGYEVGDQRARSIARDLDSSHFRDRNEKEFAGYRDAADRIASPNAYLVPITYAYPFTLATDLNRYTTREPGRIKLDNNEIAERDDRGVRRVIFHCVDRDLVESVLQSLVIGYNDALTQQAADPVLLLGLFILDFLAIHPVADGNGRLSRLLTAHELIRLGYDAPRYISLEQMIYDSKNSYYAALETSQRGWHEGQHDAWPWLTYFTTLLADAYEKFETRVGEARPAQGMSKAGRVRHWALEEAPPQFRFQDAVDALPGISSATIRNSLNSLRDQGRLSATLGRDALWTRAEPREALKTSVEDAAAHLPVRATATG
ncbi:MAG TPA: Fic family protein [Solirubrobacteraceae bacterium]|jgi:Fic family protein|nr:Fic family protein [Solirubrobacteraceae bacterium]